jgi:hypothetical protein
MPALANRPRVKRAPASRLLLRQRALPRRGFVRAVRIRLDKEPASRLKIAVVERSIRERSHQLSKCMGTRVGAKRSKRRSSFDSAVALNFGRPGSDDPTEKMCALD